MTTDPWAELAAELAALIPRLRDGDVLILTGDKRFVQIQQTPRVLAAEAVANRYLPVERRLSPEAESELTRLGWRPPDPPFLHNWSRYTNWPLRTRDADELAGFLVSTLRDVFEVRHPSQLEERAFNSIDDSETGPGGLASLRQPVAGPAAEADAPVDGPASGDSILGRLQPHGWSPEDVTAYEIAVDGIHRVIGIYTGRLHEQRDDPAAVAESRAEIARWADVQQQLRIGDRERVAEVRRQCSAIVREAGGRPAP
jgi:hypothetical protein